VGIHVLTVQCLILTGFRSPVVIFLSDGEDSINDAAIRTLCRASISLGWVHLTESQLLRLFK
jgi:hypothetical protein